MVVEESVGIWPRKDVPGPVTTDEPTVTADGLPVMPMQAVIDNFRDAREAVDGEQNLSFDDPFPVTWPHWKDQIEDPATGKSYSRKAVWSGYENNLNVILEKGSEEDVDDDWMIQPDDAGDHLMDVSKKVKARMREVVARSLPPADDSFAGLAP